MGGRSGGSAALSQTQWRHAVSVDGVGRVVQVRVGGTAQRQDRPVLGPSVGTPPQTGASASSASIANGSRQRILQSPVSTGLEKTRHSPLFHLRGYQSLGHRTVQTQPCPSVPTYKVEEFDGTLVQGTFYEPELQRVTVDDDTLWRIEKVLKRRGDQWYVQWKGWPRKYNGWIPRQDLAS